MDDLLVKSGTCTSNVEIGKFTALMLTTATYDDGVDVASTANAGPLAGIAQESILPQGFNDYSGGQYQITSGTTWPSGAIPTTVIGRKISFMMSGISRVVAGTAVNYGAELNTIGVAGKVKAVSEATATLVYVVGMALQAASTAGEVIRAHVNLYRRGIAGTGA